MLEEEIAKAESRLKEDPEVTELAAGLAAAQAVQKEVAARLSESDHAREDHRTRLRSREKELMSGRIRNPTELMQMSEEVDHMKARFAQEEDAELQLMEEADAAEQAVDAATRALEESRRRSAAEEPGLIRNLDESRSELAEVKVERDEVWAEVPPDHKTAFKRVRIHPVVAQVAANQCTVCRVAVTSSGMQGLRKGDAIVNCENCGRILVLA